MWGSVASAIKARKTNKEKDALDSGQLPVERGMTAPTVALTLFMFNLKK